MISRKCFGLLLASCLLSCILASAVNKNLVNVRIRRSSIDGDEKFKQSADSSADYINDEDPDDGDAGDEEDNYDGNDDDQPNVVSNEEPVLIISKPVNYTLQEKDSVWLPCNINRLESASVKWTKGSDNIYVNSFKISQNARIHRYDNNTISIIDFTKEDTGIYTCEITNGNRLKISYHINMVSPPNISSILPEGKRKIVIEGAPLTIECKASGNPKPKITWSRKGKRITDDDIEFIDQSIFIKHVHRKDSGTYQCLADNGIGNPAHGSVDIKVLHAPEVHIKKSVVNTDEGYEAELFCDVHSDPISIIKWFKDGNEIKESSKYRIIHGKNGRHLSLMIKDVQPEDFGVYFCNASNHLGSNVGHIKLVKQPGRALWNTGSQDQGDSNPILEWTVESMQKLTDVELKYSKIDEVNPNPEIKEEDWVVVRPNIDDPEGNKYIIRHVIQGLRPGKYVAQLRAKNAHGWSELSDQHAFDGDYESNEIRAEERLDEGKVAEIGTGIASVSHSTVSTLLVSLILLYIAKIY